LKAVQESSEAQNIYRSQKTLHLHELARLWWLS